MDTDNNIILTALTIFSEISYLWQPQLYISTESTVIIYAYIYILLTERKHHCKLTMSLHLCHSTGYDVVGPNSNMSRWSLALALALARNHSPTLKILHHLT